MKTNALEPNKLNASKLCFITSMFSTSVKNSDAIRDISRYIHSYPFQFFMLYQSGWFEVRWIGKSVNVALLLIILNKMPYETRLLLQSIQILVIGCITDHTSYKVEVFMQRTPLQLTTKSKTQPKYCPSCWTRKQQIPLTRKYCGRRKLKPLWFRWLGKGATIRHT